MRGSREIGKGDKQVRYAAFGLTIASELALPELEALAGEAPADVEIRLGRLAGPGWDGIVGIESDRFRLRIDRIGRFEAVDGRSVTVDPDAAATPAEVRAYLLGTVFGALFQQRGLLALHASAVAVREEAGERLAIAFVGESGAGKSTLAMAMSARGHKLLCDDVCVVRPSDGEAAIAWPGVRRLKLWSQSIHAGGGSTEGLEPVLQREDKYHVPADAVAPYRPYRLAGIYLLGDKGGHERQLLAPKIERLRGAQALQVLVSHTFRGRMVPFMASAERHFRACLDLLEQCPVHRFDRPGGLDAIAAHCDAIEQHLEKKV